MKIKHDKCVTWQPQYITGPDISHSDVDKQRRVRHACVEGRGSNNHSRKNFFNHRRAFLVRHSRPMVPQTCRLLTPLLRHGWS